MELKEKTNLTREAAAARLHAIADELASNNDVVIERGDLRFVAHVPDQSTASRAAAAETGAGS
jgi:hypothetical protein